MPNLKEVRNRITSVGSTRQITSAMKMVSAAKLKRAQDAITRLRPYAGKLREILQNLSSTLENSAEGVYSSEREVKNVLLVAVTSNRGLCGGFNSNIIKRSNRAINEDYAALKASNGIHVITIGKKATDYFKKTSYNLVSSHDGVFDDLTFDTVAPIAEAVMAEFASGKYDKVQLVYNQFKNAATQVATLEDYLPVKADETEVVNTNKVDYIFEPNKEDIVKDLIPKSLKTQLYKAILDSHAAEHGARMTAMHQATDNATELLGELKLSYNKARQAAITTEILEIGGGAAALEDG